MINLLPPAEKKELLREYWLRLGIIILCCVFVLELLTVVLFTPAYYALYINTKDLAETLQAKQVLAPKGASEAQKSLLIIKGEIDILHTSTTTIDQEPSTLLGEIVAQKPQGIDISAFTYNRTANTISMQFSGTAQTQEDLLLFRRNVKTNPRVLDFKYGSSFITQKSNIDFTATITFQ